MTTCSFLPQAIRTLRTRDTEAISLTMYSVFCIGVLLWLSYGIALVNWPMMIANSITLMLAGIIWYLKLSSVLKKHESRGDKTTT